MALIPASRHPNQTRAVKKTAPPHRLPMFFTETVAVIRHQNRSLCLLERYLNDNDYHLQQYFPAAIERRASARFAREPVLIR